MRCRNEFSRQGGWTHLRESSVIQKRLQVQLLHIKRLFRHLVTLTLDTSLERCYEYVQQEKDQREDPGHSGETVCLNWSGNALKSSQKDGTMEREVWTFPLRLMTFHLAVDELADVRRRNKEKDWLAASSTTGQWQSCWMSCRNCRNCWHSLRRS